MKIEINDYTIQYKDLVSFNSNKYFPVHRWFNFVEGYSREFVRQIISEQPTPINACLDPFGGVGTTSLTCQELGIKCYTIENNPFFFDVIKAKLHQSYNSQVFVDLLSNLELNLNKCLLLKQTYPELQTKTLFENKKLNKWIFNKSVVHGIMDILSLINLITDNHIHSKNLFMLAVASMLIDLSNVFRNGKCLSYKDNWEDSKISRKEVHKIFLRFCNKTLLLDLRTIEQNKHKTNNEDYAFHGDSRQKIASLKDNSIDLVITSPPYLNSRDYTDIYRLELWMLGYITKYTQERELRKSALTSHVQIQLEEFDCLAIKDLKKYVKFLYSLNGQLWNKNIPNMVKGYFVDMKNIFSSTKSKLKKGAKLYINVSNSAYAGKVIEVDKILAKIAKDLGYKIIEIRQARFIKSSGQQALKNKIRESVIVLEN